MSTRDVVFGRAGIPVLTAVEAAAQDRHARERGGIPERLLMENAGRSAAQIIDRLYPRGRILAAVGSGNNGGDGLVLLRTLRAWGREVAYLPAGSRLPDPALRHGYDIPCLTPDLMDAGAVAGVLAEADLLVDALLGTGTGGAPREPVASVIRALNASGRPIVALDLPSGVDATTGAAPGAESGAAVRATCTITFGWPKQGLLFHPARSYCGRLLAVEVGFPPLAVGAHGAVAVAPGAGAAGETGEDAAVRVAGGAQGGSVFPGCELITPDWARARLPARPPTAHKGVSGRLLVVAGREGMAGAALIAAEAALRAGAGYLWLASAAGNRVPLQTALPEAIFIDRADRDTLSAPAESAAAVLIGPGLGVDAPARDLLESVLTTMAGKPALLDADALTLLGEERALLERVAAGRELVLTPHPGEMRRLTGRGVEEIVADPVGVAGQFVREHGCVVVLKGMPSVVAAPGAPVLINTVGSSDLARAGMGDQLAGVIAAMLAAGAASGAAGSLARDSHGVPGAAGGGPGESLARTAAGLGLFYSGRAADLAARGRSLGPRDLSAYLDRAFADPGPAESPLGLPFITFDQSARW